MSEGTIIMQGSSHDLCVLRNLNSEIPSFSKFIRQIAQERFAYISGSADVVVGENPNWDDFAYGSNLAVILIAGKDFKIYFKAHFHPKKYARALAPDKDLNAVFDLFREYCNLMAGAIKKGLQVPGIVCGISLPSVTSGYDELIFSDAIRKDRSIDCFDIACTNFRFTVTTTLDTGNQDILHKLVLVVPETQLEDEIDFL